MNLMRSFEILKCELVCSHFITDETSFNCRRHKYGNFKAMQQIKRTILQQSKILK